MVESQNSTFLFFVTKVVMASAYSKLPLSEDSNLLSMNDGVEVYEMKDSTPVDFTSAQGAIPTGQMNSVSTDSRVGAQQEVGFDASRLSIAAASVIPSFLHSATHPYVCVFHFLFKALSVFTYWTMYMFTQDVSVTFILTTIFLSFDFWTVKNVTGRILVGLRWWNKVNDDGSSEWIFESGGASSSALDKNVFWIGLYAFPMFWILAAISNFLAFSPNFFMLNVMGLLISGTNALGYSKCSRTPREAVEGWASTVVVNGLLASQSV